MSGLSERLEDWADGLFHRGELFNGTDEEAADLLREAASLIDQQEKALEAADGLSEAVSKFSILSGMFDPEISRAAYANDFYRSARTTSTKEDG